MVDTAKPAPGDALPLLVDRGALQVMLGTPGLVVVDVGRAETYAQAHVPGAVHLDYGQIVATQPPAMGLLPSAEQLGTVLSRLGLQQTDHVVAYDDEGGGRAARFLWTLDVVGHSRSSLLDGGIQAWLEEGGPVTRTPASRIATSYPTTLHGEPVADKRYVLEHLGDATIAIVDTRTHAEYAGATKRAERIGHIPGAINFDWVNAMTDPPRNLRLRSKSELSATLVELGITPDKEVIAYCQTHHRSAHTYWVLKYLGYPRIRGYPGSWSEWGNDAGTPIE